MTLPKPPKHRDSQVSHSAVGKRAPGSFDIAPRGMATDRRMSDRAVRVVLYIRSYGDRAFPSYGTIARELGIHRTTAIAAVKQAVACGYIEKNGRKDPQGDRTSNSYRIAFDQQGGGSPSATTPPGGGSPTTTRWSPPDDHGGSGTATTVVAAPLPYQESLERELLNENQPTLPCGLNARARADEEEARQDHEPEQSAEERHDAVLAEVAASEREQLRDLGVDPRHIVEIEAEVEAYVADAARTGRPGVAPGDVRAATLGMAVEELEEGAPVVAVLRGLREARQWLYHRAPEHDDHPGLTWLAERFPKDKRWRDQLRPWAPTDEAIDECLEYAATLARQVDASRASPDYAIDLAVAAVVDGLQRNNRGRDASKFCELAGLKALPRPANMPWSLPPGTS